VLVRESRQRVLFAVVDAIGEGTQAWHTAVTALAHLRTVDLTMGLVSLLRGLHLVLEGTAGAEATVGLLSGTHLHAVRIGSIELVRTGGSPLALPATPGLLGCSVGRPRVEGFTVAAGERLALLSDGVAPPGQLQPLLQPARMSGLDPASSCQEILQQGWRGDDDGTVLVIDLE
jgi:hypothetical protein